MPLATTTSVSKVSGAIKTKLINFTICVDEYELAMEEITTKEKDLS